MIEGRHRFSSWQGFSQPWLTLLCASGTDMSWCRIGSTGHGKIYIYYGHLALLCPIQPVHGFEGDFRLGGTSRLSVVSLSVRVILCYTTEVRTCRKELASISDHEGSSRVRSKCGLEEISTSQTPWVGRLLNKDAIPARVRQIDFCDLIMFH